MKKYLFLISTVLLFSLLSACANNKPAPNAISDANMVETIVAGTLSAIPSATLTPVPSVPSETLIPVQSPFTGTPAQTLAPLYSELTWENLGSSEQEVWVNQQTNERITLSGYAFQALFPSESNDLENIFNFYSTENMANMEWVTVGGAGGTEGILTEYYNKTGYFLTIWTHNNQPRLITVWISDETTIVPVVPVK